MKKTRTIKSNVKWYEWQSDVIRSFFAPQHRRFTVVKSSRQCGKSVMCESILLKVACDAPCFSMYLSPTLRQSRKVFKEIKSAISRSSIYYKSNESYLEILLRNGSTIAFVSAEQGENLRGYTINGCLICDEAAYIDDEVFSTILPCTDVNKAPVLIVSTPRWRVGFFYEYYREGLANSTNIRCFDWSSYDKSKVITDDMLAFYKERLPQQKFIQDYLGEFTDLGYGVFGAFDECLYDPTGYTPQGQIYMSCDWAAGVNGDETAIVVWDEKKHMLDLSHFNDKDDLQTIDTVMEMIQKWNPTKVTVETNSIGQIFFNMLKRRCQDTFPNVRIAGFNTSNESKNRIVEKMQVAIQNKEVYLIREENLILQMGQFESKMTGAGKVTYAASKNNHDDIVMSMLIGFDSISHGGTYNIF